MKRDKNIENHGKDSGEGYRDYWLFKQIMQYICTTDMIKAKDGDFFVTDWLRNRNTLEYLGIWEQVNNPLFNYGEFAIIKSKSGLNNFKISVKEFVERTSAIGLYSKAGRYGGTYAHKDIAFEFAMWISPEFKIYLVREFQRLKEKRNKSNSDGFVWRYCQAVA